MCVRFIVMVAMALNPTRTPHAIRHRSTKFRGREVGKMYSLFCRFTNSPRVMKNKMHKKKYITTTDKPNRAMWHPVIPRGHVWGLPSEFRECFEHYVDFRTGSIPDECWVVWWIFMYKLIWGPVGSFVFFFISSPCLLTENTSLFGKGNHQTPKQPTHRPLVAHQYTNVGSVLGRGSCPVLFFYFLFSQNRQHPAAW